MGHYYDINGWIYEEKNIYYSAYLNEHIMFLLSQGMKMNENERKWMKMNENVWNERLEFG